MRVLVVFFTSCLFCYGCQLFDIVEYYDIDIMAPDLESDASYDSNNSDLEATDKAEMIIVSFDKESFIDLNSQDFLNDFSEDQAVDEDVFEPTDNGYPEPDMVADTNLFPDNQEFIEDIFVYDNEADDSVEFRDDLNNNDVLIFVDVENQEDVIVTDLEQDMENDFAQEDALPLGKVGTITIEKVGAIEYTLTISGRLSLGLTGRIPREPEIEVRITDLNTSSGCTMQYIGDQVDYECLFDISPTYYFRGIVFVAEAHTYPGDTIDLSKWVLVPENAICFDREIFNMYGYNRVICFDHTMFEQFFINRFKQRFFYFQTKFFCFAML